MQKRSWLALTLLLGLGIFLIPATASAFIYHHGEAAIETGDLPESLENNAQLKGMLAGYKCDTFSILWAYIYLDDCSAVVFEEVSSSEWKYFDDEALPGLEDALEDEYSEDDMKINAWGQHGKWVLGLVILLFIGSKFMGGSVEMDEEADLSALNDSFASDDAAGDDAGGDALSDLTGGDDAGDDDGPLG